MSSSSSSSAPAPASGRVDLDGAPVAPLTICMIGAGGFIGSHLCEKLMAETRHTVLAVDVYCDKIRHLVDPAPPHLAGRISFHRLNIKNDSRLEGLIKMADLVPSPPPHSLLPLMDCLALGGILAPDFLEFI
jgi:UDP-apiose/xylose synthase